MNPTPLAPVGLPLVWIPCVYHAIHLHCGWGCTKKSVDNFSHESDVTSLQDPCTARPEKTHFYFIILFHVKYEEASYSVSSFPDLLTSCLAVLTTCIQLTGKLSLEWAHACLLFHSAHASVTTSVHCRETFFFFFSGQDTYSTRLFVLPCSRAGRLFDTWATTLFSYVDKAVAPHQDFSAVFSY